MAKSRTANDSETSNNSGKKKKGKVKKALPVVLACIAVAVLTSGGSTNWWGLVPKGPTPPDTTTPNPTETPKTDEEKIADGKKIVRNLINNDGHYEIGIKSVKYDREDGSTTVCCQLSKNDGSSKISVYKFNDVKAENENEFYKEMGESGSEGNHLVNMEKVTDYGEVSNLAEIFGKDSEENLKKIENQLNKVFGTEEKIYQKYGFNIQDNRVTYTLSLFISGGDVAEEGKIVEFKLTGAKNDLDANKFMESLGNKLFNRSSHIGVTGDISLQKVTNLIREANKEAENEETKGEEVKKDDPNASLGM